MYTDWTPVDFAYPLVTPVAEVLDQITPRPYRPYKPGRYQSASIFARTWRVLTHQLADDFELFHSVTMGIRQMDWQSWVEVSAPRSEPLKTSITHACSHTPTVGPL